jgi:hypothetical protein
MAYSCRTQPKSCLRVMSGWMVVGSKQPGPPTPMLTDAPGTSAEASNEPTMEPQTCAWKTSISGTCDNEL